MGPPSELFNTHTALLSKVTGLNITDILNDVTISDVIRSDLTKKPLFTHEFIDKTETDLSNKVSLQSGKLIEKEKILSGHIRFLTYLKYFASSLMRISKNINGENLFYYESAKLKFNKCSQYLYGFFIVVGIIFLFTLAQVARVAVDLFLARWAASGAVKNSIQATTYYASIGVLITSLLLRSVYLNTFAILSSKHIHSSMLRHVLSAPITVFFDTHTIGLCSSCLLS
jgi:hypothetical protein